MSKYIMALDSGTTSNKCILFNKKADVCSVAQKEFTQFYPKPGWVEHDPTEIWKTQLKVAQIALNNIKASATEIASIGITNQRETTIVWDKNTGEPVYNAIVWQCRRTAKYCDELKKNGHKDTIREKTGLIIDAYFSATKIKWILDNVEGAKEKANKGDLLFGTVETWLIWNFTKGKVHATDVSNASRTMLMNIHTLKWDEDLLKLFDIPKSMMPEIKPNCSHFGNADPIYFGRPIKITGAGGDQQCALFGQTCFEKGEAKNTYGTGCFLLMNTGSKAIKSSNGLITSVAWSIDNKINYALEGSVFVGGAAVQWLRDELKLISHASFCEQAVKKVQDTNGCYVVPAFTGIGAPYWDQHAKGAIFGLTRGVNKYHIIRATLDSIVYQSADVLNAMINDVNCVPKSFNVDGGASENNYLMQRQADVINHKVTRPACFESTALGAAYMAGLQVGFWDSLLDIKKNWKINREFIPSISAEERLEQLNGWHKALNQVLTYK